MIVSVKCNEWKNDKFPELAYDFQQTEFSSLSCSEITSNTCLSARNSNAGLYSHSHCKKLFFILTDVIYEKYNILHMALRILLFTHYSRHVYTGDNPGHWHRWREDPHGEPHQQHQQPRHTPGTTSWSFISWYMIHNYSQKNEINKCQKWN